MQLCWYVTCSCVDMSHAAVLLCHMQLCCYVTCSCVGMSHAAVLVCHMQLCWYVTYSCVGMSHAAVLLCHMQLCWYVTCSCVGTSLMNFSQISTKDESIYLCTTPSNINLKRKYEADSKSSSVTLITIIIVIIMITIISMIKKAFRPIYSQVGVTRRGRGQTHVKVKPPTSGPKSVYHCL